MLTRLDLNSDMGERAGPEGLALDAELMPLITSVNIACGGHAGSHELMRRTARLAAQHHVAIGAHPGLPDRASFGREERTLPPEEILKLVVAQVRTLADVLAGENLMLNHVKPHGALYNMAARDPAVARAITDAVIEVDRTLLLYALAGSVLTSTAQAAGLTVVHEAFADRRYRGDGSLLPRKEVGAVLEREKDVLRQLRELLNGQVTVMDGAIIPIKADSLCLHSDTPQAVALARIVRWELDSAGIHVAPVPRATR